MRVLGIRFRPFSFSALAAFFLPALAACFFLQQGAACCANLEDTLVYGVDALERGRFARAERAFADVLERDPTDLYAMTRLGVVRAELGRKNEARDLFEAVLAHDPDNLFAMRMLGLLDLEQKEYRAAEGRFMDILKRRPDNADALACLGAVRILENRVPEAAAFLVKAGESASADDRTQLFLAKAWASLNLPANAQLALERCLEANPRRVPALCELGLLFFRQGRPGLAKNAWRQALAVRPADARARALLTRVVADEAMAMEMAGKKAKAKFLWRVVLQYDPQNQAALSMLAARRNLAGPEPRSGKTREAGGGLTPEIVASVKAFLETWRRAWQAGDLEAYVACYAASVVQGGLSGKKAVAERKRRVWRDHPPVRIRFGAPDFVLRGDDVVVTFALDYQGKGYAEKSRKRAILTRVGRNWRIVRERAAGSFP